MAQTEKRHKFAIQKALHADENSNAMQIPKIYQLYKYQPPDVS